MTFRWRADDDPTLNASLVALSFSGMQISIAKTPYIFVIFRGGGGGPDPLSPLWIRPCHETSVCVSRHIKYCRRIPTNGTKRKVFQNLDKDTHRNPAYNKQSMQSSLFFTEKMSKLENYPALALLDTSTRAFNGVF